MRSGGGADLGNDFVRAEAGTGSQGRQAVDYRVPILDADDADHTRAVTVARQLGAERRASFIANYIEVETQALLVRRLGRAIAREWLFTGGLAVVRMLPEEEPRAREILARHTDKDWTLCDAISFAVIEARHVARAFTFNHHFRQYGHCRSSA